jgi:hypothetical protein
MYKYLCRIKCLFSIINQLSTDYIENYGEGKPCIQIYKNHYKTYHQGKILRVPLKVANGNPRYCRTV